MQRGWTEPSEERAVKHFLDFCFDDVVSSFELGLLIKWFGPIELAFKNLILTLKSGYAGPPHSATAFSIWSLRASNPL